MWPSSFDAASGFDVAQQFRCYTAANTNHVHGEVSQTFWIACARWPAPTSQNLPSRRVLPSVPTATVRGRQADPLVGLMGCSVCARGGSARRCYAFCCLRGGPVNRCKGDSATECTVLRGRSDGWRGGSPGRQGCSCGLEKREKDTQKETRKREKDTQKTRKEKTRKGHPKRRRKKRREKRDEKRTPERKRREKERREKDTQKEQEKERRPLSAPPKSGRRKVGRRKVGVLYRWVSCIAGCCIAGCPVSLGVLYRCCIAAVSLYRLKSGCPISLPYRSVGVLYRFVVSLERWVSCIAISLS